MATKFQQIRKLIARFRKPPKPKEPLYQVSKDDYKLLRWIHIELSQDTIVTITFVNSKASQYQHAVILHQFWKMSSQEVLEKTGFWVEK